MSNDPLEPNSLLLLGEIRGQLRELIHASNNNAMKLDAVVGRVAVLEARDQRREGAQGVVAAVMRSPALGWLVGAAISAWAILTGKVHI
jgi:hypothetical protein